MTTTLTAACENHPGGHTLNLLESRPWCRSCMANRCPSCDARLGRTTWLAGPRARWCVAKCSNCLTSWAWPQPRALPAQELVQILERRSL